jgi:hypothetical protein
MIANSRRRIFSTTISHTPARRLQFSAHLHLAGLLVNYCNTCAVSFTAEADASSMVTTYVSTHTPQVNNGYNGSSPEFGNAGALKATLAKLSQQSDPTIRIVYCHETIYFQNVSS